MWKKVQGGWGLAVGVAGHLVGIGALIGAVLPPKVAAGVLAGSAAILAANGQLVPNGHKD